MPFGLRMLLWPIWWMTGSWIDFAGAGAAETRPTSTIADSSAAQPMNTATRSFPVICFLPSPSVKAKLRPAADGVKPTSGASASVLEGDGPADREAVELEDAVDRRRIDGRVGRQRHHRRVALGLRADGGRDDVDPLLAEDRADPADHARLVRIA